MSNDENGPDVSKLSDHDLLLILNERQKSIKRTLCNHLKHHTTIEIGLLLALAGLVLKMIFKG